MIQNVAIGLIDLNIGQVPGVNNNPRDLTQEGFDLAVKSIKTFPEMLGIRTLVLIPHFGRYVTIGGNQRLRALRELGYREVSAVVVDWSVDKINEFIIKDNLSYGQWDWEMIANEWEIEEVQEWGLELPVNIEVAPIEDKPEPKSFKLTIECHNSEDFADLQQRFYTTANKIDYTQAIGCLK